MESAATDPPSEEPQDTARNMSRRPTRLVHDLQKSCSSARITRCHDTVLLRLGGYASLLRHNLAAQPSLANQKPPTKHQTATSQPRHTTKSSTSLLIFSSHSKHFSPAGTHPAFFPVLRSSPRESVQQVPNDNDKNNDNDNDIATTTSLCACAPLCVHWREAAEEAAEEAAAAAEGTTDRSNSKSPTGCIQIEIRDPVKYKRRQSDDQSIVCALLVCRIPVGCSIRIINAVIISLWC